MKARIAIILFSLLTLVAACGDTSSPDADTSPTDTLAADTDTPPDDAKTGSLACLPEGITVEGMDQIQADCVQEADLTGHTFLVEQMVMVEPDNAALLSQLNPLWAADIANDRLILLFHMVSFDPTGESKVLVGSGQIDGDTYRWEGTPSEMTVLTSQCNYETKDPVSFALSPKSVNKPIQVSQMSICGQMSGDGESIAFSYIVGALKESDATGLMVALNPDVPDLTVDLAELLDSFGVPLKIDTDGDSAPDAWSISGSLKAQRITNVELD